jgi:adenosylmethionine-8-amino-7-oxononanoate aminotransferase
MNDRTLFHRDPLHGYPVVVRGEGVYLYDDEGHRFIDGTAGAGNVTLGHGRRRIAEVMAEQARTLAYSFSALFANQPALDLAARIAAVAPVDDGRVYFVSGGSEGIETAFKLARQYHLLRGKGQKQKVIARWRSYHGASLGALAATGLPQLRAPFVPWLADFPHIDPCYPYRCALEGCAGKCNLACARQLEKAILQAGPGNVAAFVAEPVVMGGVAAGVPPPEYFAQIRAICDKYDVLFIVDEVITGFGRTGSYFAIEHWGVKPDVIVFGKGASSGYMPLGGVVMGGEIASAFTAAGEFFQHIFTYVNNPVAARVGLEVMDIIEEEEILTNATETGDYLQAKARELSEHPSVGDIRGLGLMLGIELVKDRETGEPFPVGEKVSQRLCRMALTRGLALSGASGGADWVDGDDLRYYPPLVISREEIDLSLAIIHQSLTQLEEELGMTVTVGCRQPS